MPLLPAGSPRVTAGVSFWSPGTLVFLHFFLAPYEADDPTPAHHPPFSFEPFFPEGFLVREDDVRRVLVPDVVSHFSIAVRVVRVIFL
jgi:hypothetical protein